jgi:hypothetical protein
MELFLASWKMRVCLWILPSWCVCPFSVLESLNKFCMNFDIGEFYETCQHLPVLVKIGHLVGKNIAYECSVCLCHAVAHMSFRTISIADHSCSVFLSFGQLCFYFQLNSSSFQKCTCVSIISLFALAWLWTSVTVFCTWEKINSLQLCCSFVSCGVGVWFVMCFIWENPIYGRRRRKKREKNRRKSVHFDISEKWQDLGKEATKIEYEREGNPRAIESKLLKDLEDAARGYVLLHLFRFFCFILYYFVSTHPCTQTYQHGHTKFPISIGSLRQ